MQIEVVLPDMVMEGKGDISVPGVKIPLEEGDMLRDPNADYEFATSMYLDSNIPEEECARSTDLEEASEIMRAWIRRAAHAEAFALAMEAEVERLRERNAIIGSHT